MNNSELDNGANLIDSVYSTMCHRNTVVVSGERQLGFIFRNVRVTSFGIVIVKPSDVYMDQVNSFEYQVEAVVRKGIVKNVA